MSPFLPGYKRLLNEDNYDNTETADNSRSGKDDMSHTIPDDFTDNNNNNKLQIIMTNTRRKLLKFKKIIKVLIILKLQILCGMVVL